MADAARDNNRVTTLIGVSSVDNVTPTKIKVNPTSGGMIVEATVDTTGLALNATLTDGSQKSQIVDAGGEAATVTGGKLDVNATLDTTGLATAAKQDTGNSSLSSIDGKTPALGQALAAASVPVVLTAAQITTLTPLATVAVTQSGTWDEVGINDSGNSITVDGSVTLGAGTAAVGGITGAGSNAQIKDDSFYAEGVTSGILAVANRIWNGSSYDRSPGNATDGLLVNLGTNNDVVLGAGTNGIGKLTANSGVDIGDVTINNLTTTPVYVESNITGIAHGVATVTTAGTDVAIAASTPCKKVSIQAQTDNTGLIAVGASGVDATVATGTGVLLDPGDVFEFEIDNLNDVYIDSTVSGEGVRYTYFT